MQRESRAVFYVYLRILLLIKSVDNDTIAWVLYRVMGTLCDDVQQMPFNVVVMVTTLE